MMATKPKETKPDSGIKPPYRGCPVCHGLGWIYTTKSATEGRFAGIEYPAVERCPCRELERK